MPVRPAGFMPERSLYLGRAAPGASRRSTSRSTSVARSLWGTPTAIHPRRTSEGLTSVVRRKESIVRRDLAG
jgi:hypothetical protein